MDYTALLRTAEHAQLPPIVLLHGGQGQLLEDVLTSATGSLCADPSAAVFDREVLDGRDVTVDTVVQSALTLPVMAVRRLVAVRHCQALSQKGGEPLARYVAAPNPAACLLLLADESLAATRERREHWLLTVIPADRVVALPARHGRALEDWLRERARKEGLTVSDEAARLLVAWVGDDGAALLAETRKAALAGGADNHAVGVKEVGAVVGEHRLSGVFDLTRAVERRDTGTALRTLDALLATEEPVRLIALLTREVRAAWTVGESLRRGLSVEQIARAQRWPLAAVQAYASHGQAVVAEAWPERLRRCWDVERRLKSGGEPRAELAALVVELCAR